MNYAQVCRALNQSVCICVRFVPFRYEKTYARVKLLFYKGTRTRLCLRSAQAAGAQKHQKIPGVICIIASRDELMCRISSKRFPAPFAYDRADPTPCPPRGTEKETRTRFACLTLLTRRGDRQE